MKTPEENQNEVDPRDVALGSRVRKWREQKPEMKQYHLAQAFGVSNGQMSQIESGNRALYARDLPKLCKALGVPIACLYSDSDWLIEWLEKLLRLPPDRRDDVLQYGRKVMLSHGRTFEFKNSSIERAGEISIVSYEDAEKSPNKSGEHEIPQASKRPKGRK
jgi:transcriptional regulator with XRE-family HTH domain